MSIASLSPRRTGRRPRMSIASPSADGAASTKVDARRHARTARFQSPALQRHAPTARCPSPALQRHARTARCPSPALQRHARTARCPSPALQRHARTARCPSPALQRTEQRPRRWTPGGTPPRRDVNRQPFSGTPARRDFQSLASHLTPADGATSTKVDARRHTRAARFPIASLSPHPGGRGDVHEGGRPAARPRGAIFNRQPFSGAPARRDFQSPALQRTGAASTKVDARRHARTARFQSPALQRNARTARFQSLAPPPSHPPNTSFSNAPGKARLNLLDGVENSNVIRSFHRPINPD